MLTLELDILETSLPARQFFAPRVKSRAAWAALKCPLLSPGELKEMAGEGRRGSGYRMASLGELKRIHRTTKKQDRNEGIV